MNYFNNMLDIYLRKGASNLVDPVDGHPLVLVTQLVERLHHFAERHVKVFVGDGHVQIFFVFTLQQGTLLDSGDQILIFVKRRQRL